MNKVFGVIVVMSLFNQFAQAGICEIKTKSWKEISLPQVLDEKGYDLTKLDSPFKSYLLVNVGSSVQCYNLATLISRKNSELKINYKYKELVVGKVNDSIQEKPSSQVVKARGDLHECKQELNAIELMHKNAANEISPLRHEINLKLIHDRGEVSKRCNEIEKSIEELEQSR